MKYFISRQQYYGVSEAEASIVEISMGGRSFAGPDMVSIRWPLEGEGSETNNPLIAAARAISICQLWRANGQPLANVSCGFSGGFTEAFEPMTFEALQEWAEASYAKLNKCPICNNILGEETYSNEFTYVNGIGDEQYPFCSQHCAEKDEYRQAKERFKLHARKE